MELGIFLWLSPTCSNGTLNHTLTHTCELANWERYIHHLCFTFLTTIWLCQIFCILYIFVNSLVRRLLGDPFWTWIRLRYLRVSNKVIGDAAISLQYLKLGHLEIQTTLGYLNRKRRVVVLTSSLPNPMWYFSSKNHKISLQTPKTCRFNSRLPSLY